MRISLQFFAHPGGDPGSQGGTFVSPDGNSYTPGTGYYWSEEQGYTPPSNPFSDFFSWISGVFDELRPKVPFSDILDYNPPSGTFDVNSSTNSAGEVTEPGNELNSFDPSSWAKLIEDYYDKVEDYNLAAEARANAFSSAEAQKARDWSEFMSSTAYQRAVADLKKAGINPMALFYGRVSPAGNYTSSAASAISHSMAQPNFSAASSVSSSLISAISDVATSLIDALARLIPNFSQSTVIKGK